MQRWKQHNRNQPLQAKKKKKKTLIQYMVTHLDKISREFGRPIPIIEGESGGKSWCRYAKQDTLSNNLPPTCLAFANGFFKEII